MANSTSTNWRVDPDGTVVWAATDCKLFRVSPSGILPYDKKAGRERLISWEDIVYLLAEMTHKTT